MSLQNLIKYYNLCYQTDHKGILIKNIFNKSCENKLFFEDIDDELISGALPYYPLNEEFAKEVAKKIKVNEKEKELIFASTFIVGFDEDGRGNSQKVCSPLFTFPAKITEDDGEYCLTIDTSDFRVNYQIFSDIKATDGDTVLLYSKLFEAINNQTVNYDVICDISKIIEENTVNVNTSELLIFPRLWSVAELKKIYNRKSVKQNGQFFIVPAACLTVVKKSINTRGIINELEELSNTTVFSAPIKTIFGEKNFSVDRNKIPNGYTPAVLSKAQNDIILNSGKFPFSTIVGPPGTGKTYTISALAIDKISQNKSVLIVSKTDKAVDIIAEKLEKQLNLPQIAMRAGRSNYKTELVGYLNELLSTYTPDNKAIKSKKLRRNVSKLKKKIKKIERKFERKTERELKWSKQLSKNKSFIHKIFNSIFNSGNHFEIIQEFYALLEKYKSLTTNYINKKYSENIDLILQKDRNDLKLLLKAMKSRLGTKQASLFEDIDFNKILKVFPIWLVKMSDIYRVLPMQCEMFDYVIIDEATQCDIASCIPCLQRGKKAVITGDPNQLRHFSFLSKMQQKIFAEKLKLPDQYLSYLDYKNHSILDIVAENSISNEQFVFLNEHFRSLPSIIDFSNRNIYQSKLKIMTARPYMPPNKGIVLKKTNGVRQKQGYNDQEAQEVLAILQDIFERERNLSQEICSSVGILSPFRDQVEHIRKLVIKKFSLSDLEKHNVSIETPYGFQGDERDIMLLSFALDNNSNAIAFRYADKKDVFNVAITRACNEQFLIYSIDTKSLKINSLLRQYIESFENAENQPIEANENEIKNEFAQEVRQELIAKGFEVNLRYEIAGMLLDIVATKNQKSYGIDLIGFSADEIGEAYSLERYKILKRAGLPLYPFSYSCWKNNKNLLLDNFTQLADN